MVSGLADLGRMLNRKCREFTRDISRDLDGECTWGARIAVRLHVLTCRPCRTLRGQWQVLRALASGLQTSPGEHDHMPFDVRKRLERRLSSGE